MAFELFGFKFGKKPLQTTEDDKKIKKSFVVPEGDDGAVTIEASGGFYGHYIDLDGTTRGDTELIFKYREMSMHPEVESAIDDITCESIVTEDNVPSVKLVLDDLKGISAGTKKEIAEEFDKVMELLRFNSKGYEIFRRWFIDSRIVYHIIVDDNKKNGIKELRYVDPCHVQKIKEYKREMRPDGTKIITGVNEYYIYSKDMFKAGTSSINTTTEGLRISPDAIVYVTSGLYDSRQRKNIGYLNKAIKALNQLRMMEDAVVIYRISRSPERRIFYIDTGGLPKNKAEQYIRDLANRHKNKLIYDAQTGEMRDDKRQMSMLEDYWIPRPNGSKGTQIETLPGAQNLSELEDVKYFQKKLYKSLNVPISRLDGGEQKSFSIGKSTEIGRDEVKFSKFVTRLRNKFSDLFAQVLKTQLILKNVIKPEEWDDIKDKIFYNYQKDSYFSELKNNEVIVEKMNTVAMMQPFIGTFYSNEWIKKNVLNMSDQEIEEIQKQMDKEKQEAEDAMIQQAQNELANGVPPDVNGFPLNDPNAPPLSPPMDPAAMKQVQKNKTQQPGVAKKPGMSQSSMKSPKTTDRTPPSTKV